MTTAYVGLGSNLGDRLGNLSQAVDKIAHLPSTHVEEVSRAYESVPAYDEEQPAFLNAVVEVTSGLDSDSLLEALLGIEDEMGRIRSRENGPRVIDLDLLLFGDEERESAELTLPHYGLLERDFVVVPLLEIAPHVVLPDGTHPRRSKTTVGEVIRDLGPVPDAGLEHNMPIEDTEWVEVARSEGPQAAIGGYDAGLELAREVLEQEHIPHAYEPFAPGTDTDIIGRPQVISLVVPAAFYGRASAILEEVEETPPSEPLEQAAEEAVMHPGDAGSVLGDE